MIRFNRVSAALAGCLLVGFLQCGGGSGGDAPVVQPPKSLSYTTRAAVYTECVAITANRPSSSGGAVTSYHVTPALPSGLNFNASTGVISGTPTVAAAAVSHTVTASNSAGSTTASLTITVNINATAPVVRVETPIQVAANMNPGWNLGNTLEGVPIEGDWGNPPVVGDTFDDVKTIGYKSVRIPIHFGGAHLGTGNVINAAWLNRVSDVVDMALARDLYVIVDMHHYWLICAGFQNDPDGTIDKVAILWKQIAVKLREKSFKVIFEVINEPGSSLAVDDLTSDQNNQLNAAVLKAIRDTGGINATRCVLMPMRHTDTTQAQDMVLPADDNLLVTFHYYTPWFFVDGKDWQGIPVLTWGTDAEVAELDTNFKTVKGIFVDNGIPVIVGEFGCSMDKNPPYYQWLWIDSVVQKAQECGMTTMVWDNGELLDRATHVWRDPVRPRLQIEAAAGHRNALVNTGLAYALPASSSDLVLPLVLNGNTLSWIKNGDAGLVVTQDYVVSGSTLTIRGSYLASLPSGGTTLWIGFDSGADTYIKLTR